MRRSHSRVCALSACVCLFTFSLLLLSHSLRLSGLFPALDVLSMFPLVAITLANSIQAFLKRNFRFAQKEGGTRSLRLVCRLAASLPPIAGSLVSHNIEQIIQFAAFPGIYIGFIVPPLLQYYSTKKVLSVFICMYR